MRSRLTYLISLLTVNQRKHAFRWLCSLHTGYLLDKPSPWLTFDAIEFLNGRIKREMRVFEYGSGGSTLFWLHWDATCTSVEHDLSWYSVVSQRLASWRSIDYRLVPPETRDDASHSCDRADPESYASGDTCFRNCSFRNYVSQIDAFPNEHFDIVLIDGRARPACIKHSACKVKLGGLLIIDNSERDYYFLRTKPYLGNFQKKEFLGVGPVNEHMWKTDIHIRTR